MPSFISNFSFLRRALTFAGVALLLYAVAVQTGVVPVADGLNQWQDNTIRAQRFLYGRAVENRVALAGSSLTARLQPGYFPFPVANLAQSGGGPETGMQLALRVSHRPQILLVEIGESLLQPADQSLIDALLRQPGLALREHLPMLRRDRQPVTVCVDLLRKWSLAHSPAARQMREADPPLRDDLVAVARQMQAGELSPADRAAFRARAMILQREIGELQREGVRVVLLRMPGEASVEQEPRQRELRDFLRELFPAKSFTWLPEPPPRAWHTVDGVHLGLADARFFAQYVADYLQNQIQPRPGT